MKRVLILSLIGLAMLLMSRGVWAMTEPRGIRNNNPGNLIFNPAIQWQGQTGHDEAGYAVFDTPEHGIRALKINLYNQQHLHGLNTVTAIIEKYAPPSENDTQAYIADVAMRIGAGPNQYINLGNPALLSAFVQAVIHHENGMQPYDVAMIDSVVRAA